MRRLLFWPEVASPSHHAHHLTNPLFNIFRSVQFFCRRLSSVVCLLSSGFLFHIFGLRLRMMFIFVYLWILSLSLSTFRQVRHPCLRWWLVIQEKQFSPRGECQPMAPAPRFPCSLVRWNLLKDFSTLEILCREFPFLQFARKREKAGKVSYSSLQCGKCQSWENWQEP